MCVHRGHEYVRYGCARPFPCLRSPKLSDAPRMLLIVVFERVSFHVMNLKWPYLQAFQGTIELARNLLLHRDCGIWKTG